MVALIVATFIDKDWTVSDNVAFWLIGFIGLISAIQRITQKHLDRLLAPGGESDDERIKRLLREVLAERPDDRDVVNERPDDI